ncbi:MAG TPA: peroxiredoxin [Mycobacteriales bacterium]|nr:peroxiredoxin [Mycobacteriales bacterium]
MAIAVGSKVPDVEVKVIRDGKNESAQTGELLGTGKVVLVGVPGAFTPTCSNQHLPGFVEHTEELFGKGVDRIACISVNDAWVMDAWGQAQGVGEDILMIGDGNGAFSDAMELTVDLAGAGLGRRSARYAAIIEDGVITSLNVEANPGVDASSCSTVLATLG